jgi:hypothetical protein
MPIDIINTAKEVANAVKKFNDVPLMNQVFELQQALLDLQNETMTLKQQLEAANKKLNVRGTVIKRGTYFYKTEENDPLCPSCWQKNDLPVYLLPPEYGVDGIMGVARKCPVCKQRYTQHD